MTKLITKLSKFIPVLNSLLLIIVISILIVHFGIKLEQRSIDVLVAIAAIVSTFFLFLAFKESKKANDYNISQPLFAEFEKQIEEVINKSKENLLTDFTISYINKYIKNDLVKINDITYSNFIYKLKKIYNEITKTKTYDNYMSRLGYSETALLSSDPDSLFYAQNFTIIFYGIKIGIYDLFHHYLAISNLYSSIFESVLFNVQKEILFSRLDSVCNEYNTIVQIITSNETENKQVILFKSFAINNENLISRSSIEFDSKFVEIFEKIEHLKIKGQFRTTITDLNNKK